jgi:hypothetical protein
MMLCHRLHGLIRGSRVAIFDDDGPELKGLFKLGLPEGDEDGRVEGLLKLLKLGLLEGNEEG